jgi:hypothetical protein
MKCVALQTEEEARRTKVLCGLAQSLQENGRMLYETRPEVFSLTAFPIHYSLITPPFDAL